MATRTMRKGPEIVFRQGKPTSVILGIREYETLLEKAEDAEDLRALRTLRRRPLHFKKLKDFLKEYSPRV